jgi:hypothetical protein
MARLNVTLNPTTRFNAPLTIVMMARARMLLGRSIAGLVAVISTPWSKRKRLPISTIGQAFGFGAEEFF